MTIYSAADIRRLQKDKFSEEIVSDVTSKIYQLSLLNNVKEVEIGGDKRTYLDNILFNNDVISYDITYVLLNKSSYLYKKLVDIGYKFFYSNNKLYLSWE